VNILLEEITFRRDGRQVLDVPRLEFTSGTVTALVGRNGSGKTTLLRLIAALERPAAGAITIEGVRVRNPRDAAKHVAIAFQRPVVLRGTVRGNLELGLGLRGLDVPIRSERITEVASAFGIEHLLNRSAHSLSGGEAQRVNLARALSLRAPVTLLDEPLAGLDAETHTALLRELPGWLRQFGTTVIIVTHDPREATRLASNMVLLDAGRAAAQGAIKEMLVRPPNAGAAAYFGFTIVPRSEGGAIAIAPGGLRLGAGGLAFEVLVEQVVSLGLHRELVGTIDGAAVTVAIGDGDQPPVPGQTVTAYADLRAVHCFDGAE
jgi:ABC-type sugar transport system ATPase subunit